MTVKKLKQILDLFENEDADIFLSINDQLVPLCGKMDRVMLSYFRKDDPTKTLRGHEVLLMFPCECGDEVEDQKINTDFNQN